MTTALIFFVSLIIFGGLAIYFSIQEEKAKKLLSTRERELNRKFYEISILKEVADRIGYSLDIEKIVDIITGSLRNLFPYSTASSLLIFADELQLKIYVEERVSHAFVENVKMRMLESLKALYEGPIPAKLNESLAGVVLDDLNKNTLASFFNIPLVINNRVVGLINISSQKSGLYKEEEMTILYRITNQASQAVSKLKIILETEKGKLLAMISSLADGVFMVDVDTRLHVYNPNALNFLAINKTTPTIFDIIDSLTGKLDIRTKIEEAIKTNKLVVVPEVEIQNRTLQIFITPVIGKDGQILGAAVLLHDITAEKSLAEMKEDFTNIMVHELRAPLTVVKQAANLLLENKGKLEEVKVEKFLKMISESSESLLTEVSDLLDAAKLEAGKFDINPNLGNLTEVINEKINFFMPLARDKNINLIVAFEPNLPEISFDKTRVAQVLNNLLSNALKFTNANGNIKIAVKHKEDGVEISVADNGIGIPREKQDLLFSKFSTLKFPHPTTRGTGLGLYVARGIIEAHGGKIELESEVGRGTTVTFFLPQKPSLLN